MEGAKVAAGTDEAVVEVDGFLRADKRKHPGPAADRQGSFGCS